MFSAAFGAGVGGIATLAGSVVVNRRELVRGERVHLYQELVPPLRDATSVGRWTNLPFAGSGDISYASVSDLLDPMLRAATIAGRRDRDFVQAFADLVTEREALLDSRRAEPRDGLGRGVLITGNESKAFSDRGLQALDAFSGYLERKIR